VLFVNEGRTLTIPRLPSEGLSEKQRAEFGVGCTLTITQLPLGGFKKGKELRKKAILSFEFLILNLYSARLSGRSVTGAKTRLMSQAGASIRLKNVSADNFVFHFVE
jgi:hypothetical protein